MTEQVMTTTNLDAAIAKIITYEGILANRGQSGWIKNCTFFPQLGKQIGDTISVPVFPTFTPEIKTNQTTKYTLQSGNENASSIDLKLEKEVVVYVGYSVLAQMALYKEHIPQIMKNIYTSIYEQFAADVAAAVVDGSSGFSLSTGTYGNLISTLEIQDAAKQLFDKKYPIIPDKVSTVLCSNDFYKGLLTDETLSTAQKETARDMGFVKNFAGTSIYPSQYVDDDDSTGSKNFMAYMPEIYIANSVPISGPKNSQWINIIDPESGLIIQMYEFGNGERGTDETVVRTSYDIALARRTCGVIIKGAI